MEKKKLSFQTRASGIKTVIIYRDFLKILENSKTYLAERKGKKFKLNNVFFWETLTFLLSMPLIEVNILISPLKTRSICSKISK